MTEIASRIRALSPEQLDVLDSWLRQRRLACANKTVASPVHHISPIHHIGDAPLSFAQERLWFIEQMQPGTAIYNLYTPVRFRGPLDLFALQRSLDEIVRRHQTLRTKFLIREGTPAQIVTPPLSSLHPPA